MVVDNDKRVNGWTNWETWHTALLIDNEESSQRKKEELVKRKVSVGEFKRVLRSAETETRKLHSKNRKNNPRGWGKFDPVNWDEIHKNAMEEF